MKKTIIILSLCLGIFPAAAHERTVDEVAIIAVLDDFHDAAANGDKGRYLGHFMQDGVFLGTDEWERWPLKPDFTNYVAGRFKDGIGWVYKSEMKNIAFSKDGKVAWFDETSVNQRSGGRYRGSGVLEKVDGTWKIAQYVLSVLVYNEVAGDVNKIIDGERMKRAK